MSTLNYNSLDVLSLFNFHFFPLPIASMPSEIVDIDVDGDGIVDIRDECIYEPEDFDGFEDSDGCPEPDNDQDGFSDERDKSSISQAQMMAVQLKRMTHKPLWIPIKMDFQMNGTNVPTSPKRSTTSMTLMAAQILHLKNGPCYWGITRLDLKHKPPRFNHRVFQP